jgi:hypothetical protein
MDLVFIFLSNATSDISSLNDKIQVVENVIADGRKNRCKIINTNSINTKPKL